MKFIATAFAALAAVATLPAAYGVATQFGIGGGDFTTDWDTYAGDTNSVTITFDEKGEAESAFNVEVALCAATSEYTITTPLTQDSSADMTVTFQNSVSTHKRLLI